MVNMEIWQAILALIGVAGALIAPTVHYTRKFSDTQQQDQKSAFQYIREDLKEFRNHFDSKISEVYTAVDVKNKDLKDHFSNELNFIKHHITEVEFKLDSTRERSHEIEKDLLRLQTNLSKDFITKEQLNDILALRRN